MSLRDALEADGDPDLFPHQRADVQFLATTRRAILASQVGHRQDRVGHPHAGRAEPSRREGVPRAGGGPQLREVLLGSASWRSGGPD